MAWTTPKTWNDTRDRLNSANLNQFIRDNQLALRADASALAQRVAALEGRGFSDAMERNLSFTGQRLAVLTDLVPPVGTRFIYCDFLLQGTNDVDFWSPGPLVDYAMWNAKAEVNAGDRIEDATGFTVGPSGIRGFVAKGFGGVLAFGYLERGQAYGAVSVRWYR